MKRKPPHPAPQVKVASTVTKKQKTDQELIAEALAKGTVKITKCPDGEAPGKLTWGQFNR